MKYHPRMPETPASRRLGVKGALGMSNRAGRVQALLVLGLSAGLFLTLPATAPGQQAEKAGKTEEKVITTTSGLQYVDLVVGEGVEAVAGKTAVVNYTGWLENGTKFDSSKDRNDPFEFKLGAGQVIRGWDEGVAGMKVGGVRRLTIPPQLGYGDRGAGGVIPPKATLIFEVELLATR
jgi:FKBP-type peptidyl-prolyl cis-trans isomerase FkpA